MQDEPSYKSLKGTSPSHFQLERWVLKNDGSTAVQRWELKLVILVPGEDILIFKWCMSEDLEFWLNNFSKHIYTPWRSYWLPQSILIETKVTILCSNIRWSCVGFLRQLCRHNIIIKLRHHFIDDGPCFNSLYLVQFSDIVQFINMK